MYTHTCEFIYEKISQRARAMKHVCDLTNEDIYPINPAIASCIVNNRRTKNNPYLVPGRNADDGNEQHKTRADLIADNLKFDSTSDFLWGTEYEFKLYQGKLLNLIIDDSLFDSSLKSEEKEIIYEALALYPDYALLRVLDKKGDYYKYYLDPPPNDEIEHIIYLRAISRLNRKLNWADSFLGFFKSKTTIRLELSIHEYVRRRLIPHLKQMIMESNPLNKKITETIELLVESIPSETDQALPEYRYRSYTETEESVGEVLDELAESTSKYLDSSIEIIHRIEGDFSEEDLIDNWSQEKFLSPE